MVMGGWWRGAVEGRGLGGRLMMRYPESFVWGVARNSVLSVFANAPRPVHTGDLTDTTMLYATMIITMEYLLVWLGGRALVWVMSGAELVMRPFDCG